MAKYYKRKYKKKALSKGRIFGNRSAKSQAKQIYALNKKVNYIQKTSSPETETFSQVLFYFDSYDAAHQRLLPEYSRRFDLYGERILNSNFNSYLSLTGDLLRVKDITFYGYFGLKDWTYYDNVEEREYNVPVNAYMKIIVCKVVKAGSNFPLTLAYDHANAGPNQSTASEIRLNWINGPLISGATTGLKILAKKVVKISPEKPGKMFKIKLFNSKKNNLNYRRQIAGVYGEGEIFVFVNYVVPTSLQLQEGAAVNNVAPRCTAQMNYKIAYASDGAEKHFPDP